MTIRGASMPLQRAVMAQPAVTADMAPGVDLLSDLADDNERVVRVWTNQHTWWTSAFDANDNTVMRAIIYVRETTASGDCITSYPLRPRGTCFGVRPGQCTITVAVWTLDGTVPLIGDVKVFASISPGRPQRQEVAIQSLTIGQSLWWEPDKFNGSFDTVAVTRAGLRFADALRVSWTSLSAIPSVRIIRGSAGPTVTLPVTAPWGSVDIAVDHIIQVVPMAGETIVSAHALVYR